MVVVSVGFCVFVDLWFLGFWCFLCAWCEVVLVCWGFFFDFVCVVLDVFGMGGLLVCLVFFFVCLGFCFFFSFFFEFVFGAFVWVEFGLFLFFFLFLLFFWLLLFVLYGLCLCVVLVWVGVVMLDILLCGFWLVVCRGFLCFFFIFYGLALVVLLNFCCFWFVWGGIWVVVSFGFFFFCLCLVGQRNDLNACPSYFSALHRKPPEQLDILSTS